MRYHLRMAFRPHSIASFPGFRFAPIALFWLALLLAAAQTIAICHGYGHAPVETSSHSGGKHPGGLAHCNSCIVAAGIGGGAPPAATPLPAPFVRQPLPLSIAAAESFAPSHQPYTIRAPPIALA